MRVIPAALRLLLLSFELRADERRSMDETLVKCVDENSTTLGMVKCTLAAYDEWDAILNGVHQRLSERLTPDVREALKVSRRKWLVWRDAEVEMIDRVYATREGTMYLPMRANDRMRVVSDRATELVNLAGLLVRRAPRYRRAAAAGRSASAVKALVRAAACSGAPRNGCRPGFVRSAGKRANFPFLCHIFLDFGALPVEYESIALMFFGMSVSNSSS